MSTGRRRIQRPDSAEEIREELDAHIAARIEEYVAEGMSPHDARVLAEERFGDVERIAAACRAAAHEELPSADRAPTLPGDWGRDIRFAIRSLVRQPSYTLAVVATLTLAIGATTAVFSVVNGVLLQPLPHPEAERLAVVYEVDQRPGFLNDHNPVAPANYADWKAQNSTFDALAAYQIVPATLRESTNPQRITVGLVSAEFFPLLGAEARVGRLFLPEESEPGNDNVVVLSYEFWQAQFAGDPNITDRVVTIGTTSAPVVGVLPPRFTFLDRSLDVWSPMALTESTLQNRRSHFINVVGRLAPGVTPQHAQRDMDRVVAVLRQEYPEYLAGFGVNVVSLTDEIVGSVRPALVLLLVAVAFVLLIGIVNVANLTLARAIAEGRQLALRAALGASQGQLIRQRLAESLSIAVIGGGLGTLLAVFATEALLGVAPDTLPRVDQVGLDGRVLGFAIVISLLAGLLFGLVPAVHAARVDAAANLREGSRDTGGRRQRRVRAGFVVGQLALSLVLLISAGLTSIGFINLMRVDPGFAPERVTSADLAIPDEAYPTVADKDALYDRVISELSAQPGITSASVTWFLPFDNIEWTWSVQVDGQPPQQEGEKRDYGFHVVSPGYFQTMGIGLVRGRMFESYDGAESPLVLLVNEAFVRRFFPDGQEPLGQRVRITTGQLPEDRWMEIVGVVEDVRHYSLEEETIPAYFIPVSQMPWDWMAGEMSLVVRSREGVPGNITPQIRSTVRSIEPEALLTDVMTMNDRIARSVDRPRFAMVLLLAFASVALILALLGIYGIIAYTVGQRTRELGIRIALGAAPHAIVGRVVRDGAVLAAVGISLGLVGAYFFTRLQASLLYGISSFDPTTYAVLSAVLGGVAVLASYFPARRAGRVDPVTVLRAD